MSRTGSGAEDTSLHGVEVIVLGRGKGERLRPLTLSRPKAFCPVCNIPILNRLLIDLHRCGFKSVILSLPVLAGEEWERVQERFPKQLEVVVRMAEKPATGNFDAVRQCLSPSARRILVIYGDSFLRTDLAALVRAHAQWHRENKAAATILYHEPADRCTPNAQGRTYHGIMSCRADGLITRFVEKPLVSKIRPGFELANAAVFVVERAIFSDARFADADDFSRHIFERAIRNKWLRIYGLSIGVGGYRHDLGTPERLFEANMEVLSGRWYGDMSGRQIMPGVWRERGSQIAGARLIPPVVLGRGVKLSPGCTVGPSAAIGDGCTICENAAVSHSVLMNDTIIGAGAKVQGAILGAHCDIGEGCHITRGSWLGDYSRLTSSRPATGSIHDA